MTGRSDRDSRQHLDCVRGGRYHYAIDVVAGALLAGRRVGSDRGRVGRMTGACVRCSTDDESIANHSAESRPTSSSARVLRTDGSRHEHLRGGLGEHAFRSATVIVEHLMIELTDNQQRRRHDARIAERRDRGVRRADDRAKAARLLGGGHSARAQPPCSRRTVRPAHRAAPAAVCAQAQNATSATPAASCRIAAVRPQSVSSSSIVRRSTSSVASSPRSERRRYDDSVG